MDKNIFHSDMRLKQLEMVKKQESISDPFKTGTVGCVLLDKYGNLTVRTSTGGMTNAHLG